MSRRRTRWRRTTSLVLALTAILTAVASTAVASASDTDPGTGTIGDSQIRSLALDPGTAPPGTAVLVEVHGDDLDAVTDVLIQAGARIHATIPGHFVEASVPVEAIEAVHDHDAISRISSVTTTSNAKGLQANAALSTAVGDTLGLDAWHDDGHRGNGQRIGILDIFGAAELNAAIATGRIPTPSGTFCRRFGQNCSIALSGGGAHGVGVAEIAHTAAPEADLYLATVATTGDLSAAIDWFIANGVTVINRSETSEFDGAGDGTGAVNSVIDRAVDAGIVWVSAAGNAGGDFFRDGQNWVGTFNDPDGDNIHNWASGSERMEFVCGFLLGMRWDDWGPGIATDYDLWIYDTPTATTPEVRGNNIQADPEHPPLEHVATSCDGSNDRDYLSIVKFADAQPDGDDQIQIMGNLTPMEEWTNFASATGPGADSANPGAISVGSLVRPSSLSLAGYSSQGPTLDGRPVPTLAAASCLPAHGFAGCFSGTSSSAPLVSGLIAVLRGAELIQEPDDVQALLPRLTIDRGPTGPDNGYGMGALVIPPPAEFGVIPSGLTCLGRLVTIAGTPGDDVLVGTPGVDVIHGLDGDDTIDGADGDDVICGGEGSDTLSGGNGNDEIFGGNARDWIDGRRGEDFLRGGGGNDRIHGGHDADHIYGEGGRDRIWGGGGHDRLFGGKGEDKLDGGPGRDRMHGGNNDDQLFGRNGLDRLTGGDGLDELHGGGDIDDCPSPGDILVSCES